MISENKIQNAYVDVSLAVSGILRNPIQNNLDELKDALNKLFPETKCHDVIYTQNEDKLFFGLYAMPEMDEDEVIETITKDRRYRVKEYILELDGKLFGSYLGLTNAQITALIVHDIGMLTNNSAPSEEVVKALDKYLIDNNDTLKLSNLVHYKKILSYGFRDALRKCTSIFELGVYKPELDTFADFINWTPYKNDILRAMDKIDRLGYNYKKEHSNRFITLSWVMRIYKDVLGYRISAIKSLERLQELTPSMIEKRELANFAKRLTRIDDDMLLEQVCLKEEDDMISMMRNAKYPVQSNVVDCLDITKNDLVGIILKQENMDEHEPDSIPDLLNNINNTMMYIEDYVQNNVTDKGVFKQWDRMYQELNRRRRELSKSKFYTVSKKMVNTYKAQTDQ
jgi:hypothetical protein